MRPRSANEWRDFWRDGGERELHAQLDEFAPYSVRIATLLGSATANGSGVWTFTTGTYTVPTGKAFGRFYAEIKSSTKSSEVRFDDVILQIH